ncbi:sulfoxide reductase heme-binding subunit YedZ [Rhodovulum sulfidophilum]|uniref:Protein-methionine-sulfoxide reductase heme-binding subunit MsrQ n=1 Tax=Rhodovulum visakhapatnamense TaxID=364297 RepID=A0ABS1RDF2_9RHOB|nr:protein-methionine-sulfoxide reductase heme-binding subunit MsrQ [Rhodovulum visakhapatnamense]MBL3571755.1 protein-methionine-sulfoxide reductase heme-binding subunit MsrQ [Rhodovulum visakhapatnamense]MBL3577656.1 protein-methionine-sulfoxide reductase heme-binding subunit MsrQ [Rhodovulum visakhapatnamense]OLS43551.1 sulfoxide reductase heme-binding subunit YedZ [Rhodovulum sulfidophilum]
MTGVQRVNIALARLPTWPVYVAGMLPAAWAVWLGATGGLGVEPINALEDRLGLLALQFLIAGLAVTPLRRWTGLNLIRFRRALGLVAMGHLVLHLTVWLVLDLRDWGLVWADIVKRPYITVGMLAFALLLPLAATSSNRAIRSLGPLRWRRLHRLVYLAVPLGGLHFVMQAKGWQVEPLVYLATILGLLALRVGVTRARIAA